jgi:hypothetical protein
MYYTIRYNKNMFRSPEEMESLVRAYADLLEESMRGRNRVRVYPYDNKGEKKPLISINCYTRPEKTDDSLFGRWSVDVNDVLERNQVIGIIESLNVAFALSNLPLGMESTEINDYRFFIDYVCEKFMSLTGEPLTEEDILELVMSDERNLKLSIVRVPMEERGTEYYNWVMKLLKNV